ncbi:MAG: FHA domain-containing protein [Lachnospiraceae bacterium]|nr:FHA domain-containing protein [Lachnospiraceae bacterium]
MDILTNPVVSGVAVALTVVLVIIFLIRLGRVRSRKNELKRLAEDRNREETLDNILRNDKIERREMASKSVPYEVNYSNKNKKESKERESRKIMIQLIEHNELSIRKHILSPENVIQIGSHPKGDSILVADVSPCQCQIFCYQDEIYIRDVGERKLTMLKRGKKKVFADGNGTSLKTGDQIILGKVFFDFTLIK